MYKQSEVCVCVNGLKTKPFSVSVGLRQDCVLFPLLFLTYTNKVDKDSSSSSGVTFGKCDVWRLLFADDLALLSSNKNDLQYALDRFSDACLDAGMKISTAKTEIVCVSRHPVQCFFQTNGVTLQQTEKFKYPGVTCSCDGRQDSKFDSRIGKASAVLPYFVLKRELCTRAKLFVFRLIFVPILTYGLECWVMTERVKSRFKAAEMSFLRKVRVYPYLTK